MARPLRIEYEGGCYHVINRGNYRRNLFEGGGAAEAFERTLGEAAVRFRWRIHAYVVMRNHFHLGVELKEPNLSLGMKWLQGTWTRRSNGLRRQVGRPFQDRYKALVVEPGHTFAQVCHYIHLNPLRAGAVTGKQILSYPWNSLPRFAAKKRPEWLCAETVLSDAGSLRDNQKGWRSYAEYLVFLSTDPKAKRELTSKRLSRGWCLGEPSFRQEMKEHAQAKGAFFDLSRFAGLEPKEFEKERREQWEERLQELARHASVKLDRLPARKSAPEKVLLAAAMKQSSSVSNAWLAERLFMGQPASVSQFVGRLQVDPSRARKLQLLLSRVKT